MKTTVKYIVLKSIDYQNLRFKVVSKEQKRLQLIEENEEYQTIIVRVLVI